MDKKVLTKQGLEKLKKELEYLKTDKRKEISERIKIAQEFGDLSENAEYHEAKDDQAFNEGRILELEHLIKTSEVAEENFNKDIIGIGSKVIVEKDGQELSFSIVGSTEADPTSGRISLDSPLGNVLLNKKVGDEVEVELPGGLMKYKVIDIQ